MKLALTFLAGCAITTTLFTWLTPVSKAPVESTRQNRSCIQIQADLERYSRYALKANSVAGQSEQVKERNLGVLLALVNEHHSLGCGIAEQDALFEAMRQQKPDMYQRVLDAATLP